MLDSVTLGAESCHLGGLEALFWFPGDHLGDPGVPGDTPQDTLGSRPRFFQILGGFGDPLWIHFGSILVTFLSFGAPRWQYRFQGRFFSDLGVEITPEFETQMC